MPPPPWLIWCTRSVCNSSMLGSRRPEVFSQWCWRTSFRSSWFGCSQRTLANPFSSHDYEQTRFVQNRDHHLGLAGWRDVFLSDLLDGHHRVQDGKRRLFTRYLLFADPRVVRRRVRSKRLFSLRAQFDHRFVRIDYPLLHSGDPKCLSNGLLSDGEIAVDHAVDVIDKDDACGWCADSDLYNLAVDSSLGHHYRVNHHFNFNEHADRGLDVLHLFQRSAERDPGSRANRRSDCIARALALAPADDYAGPLFNCPFADYLGVERGVLEHQFVERKSSAAHGFHRLLLKPGRTLLGQAFRRLSVSRCTDYGNRLANAEADGTQVDLRSGEVVGVIGEYFECVEWWLKSNQ